MNNIGKELLDKIQSLENMKDSLYTACEVIGVLKFEIDNITKERDAIRRNESYLHNVIQSRDEMILHLENELNEQREKYSRLATVHVNQRKSMKVLLHRIEKLSAHNDKLTAENKFLSDKDNEPAFAFLKVVNLLTKSGFAVLHITQNKFAISRDPGKYLFFNNLDELTTYLKGGDFSETNNG